MFLHGKFNNQKVIYSGEKYSFTSPEFTAGINIIVGDNGSGKSTFSHFITYGLGGCCSI
ncbi:ATP-binding protein [Tenacibaculum maritimum]